MTMRIPRSDLIALLDQRGVNATVRRRARDELPDPVDTAADADLLEALGCDVDELERWARGRQDDPEGDCDSSGTDDDTEAGRDTDDQDWGGSREHSADAMEQSWDERDL